MQRQLKLSPGPSCCIWLCTLETGTKRICRCGKHLQLEMHSKIDGLIWFFHGFSSIVHDSSRCRPKKSLQLEWTNGHRREFVSYLRVCSLYHAWLLDGTVIHGVTSWQLAVIYEICHNFINICSWTPNCAALGGVECRLSINARKLRAGLGQYWTPSKVRGIHEFFGFQGV